MSAPQLLKVIGADKQENIFSPSAIDPIAAD
jgi:hypothetical protein